MGTQSPPREQSKKKKLDVEAKIYFNMNYHVSEGSNVPIHLANPTPSPAKAEIRTVSSSSRNTLLNPPATSNLSRPPRVNSNRQPWLSSVSRVIVHVASISPVFRLQPLLVWCATSPGSSNIGLQLRLADLIELPFTTRSACRWMSYVLATMLSSRYDATLSAREGD
jgi:hypothetical protein